MPLWSPDEAQQVLQETSTSICGGGEQLRRQTQAFSQFEQQVADTARFNQFEQQMADTARQGRRMVHNERFLSHTLRDTTSHNLRQQGLRRMPPRTAAVAESGSQAKVKVTVSEPGPMGIRMQPDKEGRPVVVSVRPSSEAAAQGVVAGLALKSVQGVSVKSVDYQVVLDWIISLEERPVFLRFGVTVPKDNEPDKKSKKRKKSAAAHKKNKKLKKSKHKAAKKSKHSRSDTEEDLVKGNSKQLVSEGCGIKHQEASSDSEPELGPAPAARPALGAARGPPD